MDVEEHFDAVGLCCIEDPLHLVLGTISAAHVRPVRFESPITDGDADDFHLASSHLLESILCDPGVPMLTKHSIALLWTQGLTERILV